MKIHSLHIQAFGKFRDFSVDFNKGLNVIYGLNESGKSTLHAFIEGMFYGFIDPLKKTRRFFKAIDKYKPRDNALYGGSMVFTFDDKTYRLERTFLKRKANVTLLNESTGEDITKSLPVHPASKLPDIGKFLDMPYMLYKNTLSIKELEAKTDSEASDALIQRLQNLKETSSESFSSQKAIEHIKSKLETIGSDKARTKPYAKALQTLSALEDEKADALTHQESSVTLKETIDELTDQKDETLAAVKTLKETVRLQDNTLKKKTYKRIMDTLDTVKLTVEKHGGTLQDYRMVKRGHKDYKTVFESLNAIKQSIKESRYKIKTYQREIPADSSVMSLQAVQSLKEDASRLTTFLTHIDDDHLQGLKDAQKEDEHDIAALDKTLSKGKTTRLGLTTLSVALSLGLIGLSIAGMVALGYYSLLTLSVPLIIFLLTHVHVQRKQKAYALLIEKTANRKKKIERLEKSQTQADKEIKTLLSKYQVDSIDAFNQMVIRSEAKLDNYKRKTRYEQSIKAENDHINQSFEQLEPVFNRFKLPLSFDAIEALNAIHDGVQTIEDDLNGKTLEAFEASINFNDPSIETESYESNQAKIQTLNHTINELETTLFEKQTILKQKANEYRNIATIDYEIAATKSQITAYENEKAIYEKAIKHIEEATNIIEENFAPILSKNIEMYLPKLTGGHYSEIKLRKDLTFKAYAQKTHGLENSSYFSTGTLDQIYFAVRLGILKTLKKSNLPFFLDDAFVNFDDERLSNVLHVLHDLTPSHQIIVFTCQTREYDGLKRLDIPFTPHTLN